MKDMDKGPGHLIDELERLRLRIKQLEAEKAGREEAANRLIDSEIRYRRLFETAQDGILILDAKTGQVTDVNPFLEIMLGYSHEEFVGKKIWEIGPFKNVKESKVVFRELQEKGYVRYEHLPLQTKDGRDIAVEFVSNVYKINHTSVIQCNIRDITERKRIEERLEKERQEFGLIVDSSPIIIFYKDKDGKVLRVNKTFAEALGIPQEKFLGKTVFDFYSAEIAQAMADDDQEVLKSGRPKLNIIEQYESTSGIRWVKTDKIPIFDENGLPTGLVGFAQDVTEWRKTQEYLLESEAKYRDIAGSITEVFFALDENLRYTYWNKASEELLGISAKEALGKSVYDIFPDDESTGRAVNAYRRALATKEPQHLVNEYSLSGRDYVFDISAYPTREGLCVYAKDITERRKLEKALEESEQWYRIIFDNTPIGIGFASLDGKVITFNKAMETITGYSAEEFNAVNIIDMYADKADREALLKELRQHGSVIDYLVRLKRKDNTQFDALLTSKLTAIGDKKFVQTIAQDVTERKRAENAIIMANERLQYLLSSTSAVIYTAKPYGDYGATFVSQNVIRMSGYEPRNFVESSSFWIDHMHPDDVTRVLAELPHIFEHDYYSYEYRFKHKDGKYIWVSDYMRLVRNDSGEPLEIVGYWVDVTERKQAEEALKESEQRYRALVELSPEAIFVASEGKHVFVNSAGLKLFGASSPDEIIRRPVMDFIHPDYRKTVAQRMRESMGTGIIAPTTEEKFLRLDGTEIDVEVRAAPLVYQGKPAMQAVVRDISERKQAEELLRLSEQNFRDSIENSPLGIRIIDEDGKALYANRAFLDMYGYGSLKELEAVPRKRLYTPQSYTEHLERVRKRKMGEYVPESYEISIVRKDGHVRYLTVSRAEVIWNGERQFQMVYQDITERKQAEEQYQTIVRTAMDGFWLIDMQGHFLDVNEAYCNLIGYRRDELSTMSIPDIEALEKPGNVAQRIRKIRDSGQDRFETCHRRKNGEIVDVEISVNYLPVDSGRMFVFIRDITQRKQAEELLRASEEHYRLLAENVRDVILAMDMDMRFTYVSPSVKYLGDRTAEEVMSMSLEQLLAPSSQELAMKTFAEELVRANTMPPDPTRSRTLEVEILRRDNSTYWAELKMSFMYGPDNRPVGILGVMRDISERKQNEGERREFEQKAQLASRLASVGELASGVAHEINNPLTGVIGYSELLMHEDVPERIKNDLEIINNGAKRVADIVKGLLKFARQIKPERALVDIIEIIEVTLRLRAYELETSNIKVTTKLAPDLPLTVADPGQLQQVFLNLLINAEMEMRLAHGKGKLIIKAEQVDNKIRISFKDDGPGIAKENLEKIFDPFFTTREVGRGTGLGLSICNGIMAEHGGRIWAESQLGKGATFIVELPIITREKRPKRLKTAVKPQKVIKGKILVVDDEPVVRQLVNEVLTAEGHEVETTAYGKDALKRIKGNGYDLILVDMKLPGMSGGELYEKIQDMSKSLAERVVFVTGDVMGADTEAFLNKAGAPFIAKPFNVKQLKAEIRRLLTISVPTRTAKSNNHSQKLKVKI